MGFKHDYLKKQIDQMARVLGMLLTDILGLKNEGKIAELEAHINNVFIKDLGFNFDEVISHPVEDLVRFLKEEKAFSDEHLNHIANILLEAGMERKGIKNIYEYYSRSIVIFEYLQSVTDTFSFDFMMKINLMKEKINTNEI